MKKHRKNMELNKIKIFFFILFNSLISFSQIDNFPLTKNINFKLSTKEIINSVLSNKDNNIVRVDTSTSYFRSLVYKTVGVDSIYIRFSKDHFSDISIYPSDSCLFFYIKAYCFENFKATKKSINNKKQLFPGKEFNISLYETKGTYLPKYNVWISSKKHHIKI